MKNKNVSVIALLIFLGALLIPNFAALAADRVALVIGNSEYIGEDVLKSPAFDALSMSQALKSTGFDVVKAENTTLEEIKEAVQQFATKAKDAKTAWFYFAGRSLHSDGKNYLVPVDAKVKDESDIASLGASLIRVVFRSAEEEGWAVPCRG